MTAVAERVQLVIDGDPEEVVPYQGYSAVKREGLGGGYVDLQFAESSLLRDLGEGLIERIPRYSPLGKFKLLYLWGSNLGKLGGEPRVWRLKRMDAFSAWALGHPILNPRYADLCLLVNSQVASRGQMTLWQVQAAVNEALECAPVRDGQIQIRPRTTTVQDYIIRRYGAWEPNLRAIAEALAAAEAEQLPLFFDGDEDEDEGE